MTETEEICSKTPPLSSLKASNANGNVMSLYDDDFDVEMKSPYCVETKNLISSECVNLTIKNEQNSTTYNNDIELRYECNADTLTNIKLTNDNHNNAKWRKNDKYNRIGTDKRSELINSIVNREKDNNRDRQLSSKQDYDGNGRCDVSTKRRSYSRAEQGKSDDNDQQSSKSRNDSSKRKSLKYTKTLPIISYCENVFRSSSSRKNVQSNSSDNTSKSLFNDENQLKYDQNIDNNEIDTNRESPINEIIQMKTEILSPKIELNKFDTYEHSDCFQLLDTIPLNLNISPKKFNRIPHNVEVNNKLLSTSPINGHSKKIDTELLLCNNFEENENRKTNSTKLIENKFKIDQLYDEYEEFMLSTEPQLEIKIKNKNVDVVDIEKIHLLDSKPIQAQIIDTSAIVNDEKELVSDDVEIEHKTVAQHGRSQTKSKNQKSKRSLSASSTSSSASSSSSSSSSNSSSDSSESDSDTDSRSGSSSSSSDSSASSKSSKRKDRKSNDDLQKKIQQIVASEDFAKIDNSTNTLEKIGINLDEELLDDDTDLMNKLQLHKQIIEQKCKSKRNKNNQNENITTVINNTNINDNGLICDPNREMISMKLKPSVPSTTSVGSKNIFENQEKQVAEVSSTVDMHDKCSQRTSSRHEDDKRRSSRSRRHSEDRKSRRSDEKRHRRSSERRNRKSEENKSFNRSRRHRSRSPFNEKYPNSNERDGERGERYKTNDRQWGRNRERERDRERSTSRNRFSRERDYPRFDRNSRIERHRNRRQSNSPRFEPTETSFHSQHRSVSPYDRQLSDSHKHSPSFWQQHSEYRRMSLSPVPRGPRTPSCTPPRESLYERNSQINLPLDTAYINQSPPRFKYDHNNVILTQDIDNSAIYRYPPRSHLGPSEYINHCYSPPRHHCQPIHSASDVTPILGSGDGYYYQTNFAPSQMMQPSELNHQQLCQSSYDATNVHNHYPYTDSSVNNNRQLQQIMPSVVQKGNVLEIVPSNEPQLETAVQSIDVNNSNDKPKNEKNDEELMRQRLRIQQEKIRRRNERHQRRLAREKRKEFVMNEIKRLSHQFVLDENGRMVKASELLKLPQYSSMLKASSASPMSDSGNDNRSATPIQPIQTYDYDINAKAGKSIIIVDDNSRDKTKKKTVVFADGILPGHGTSASDNDDTDSDEMSTKKLIARSKNKKKLARLNAESMANTLPSIDKENVDEKMDIKSVTNEKLEFVPGPPDGSPLSHLRQPKLKNPEKHNLNQLMYFHYNIHEHLMYVSPYPHPHLIPPIQMSQSTLTFKPNLQHTDQQSIDVLPKIIPRTPLSNQQKPTHSNGSNLIVLQSNSPTNSSINLTYNSSTPNIIHSTIKPRTTNTMFYTGQSQSHVAQIFPTITPVTTHQTYQTNNGTSPHLSNSNFYSSTNL